MSKPKKHHYVSQGYLKFFAQENEKGDFIINVIDKVTGKTFPANITDIAEKRNFNKIDNGRFIIPTPNGDPLYYEYKYTELIEGRIPQIISNIVTSCTLYKPTAQVLTEEIKHDFATLMVVQLFRTPLSRKFTYEIGEPTCNKVILSIREQIELLQDIEKKDQFLSVLDDFKYTEAFSKSFHLQFTTDRERIEKFVQLLVENHSWVIYKNMYYKSIPFVTSDNPVVMYNLKSGALGLGVNGLENYTTVISMPLTPKYMISLYHKSCNFGYYSQSYENKCIAIDEPKFLSNQSFLQAEQCSRQIYGFPTL